MKDADEYRTYLKALIVSNSQVAQWIILLREETQGELGLLRYRLTLLDGGLLEMFARFQIVGGNIQVAKYRFHWQDAAGGLRKRWITQPITRSSYVHKSRTRGQRGKCAATWPDQRRGSVNSHNV